MAVKIPNGHKIPKSLKIPIPNSHKIKEFQLQGPPKYT
jgi:hypothetical protein